MPAALVMLAVAATGGASSWAKSTPTCPQVQGKLLAADAQAQVFQRRDTVGRACELPSTGTVYGQVLGHGRAQALGAVPWGTTEGVGGVFNETLSGTVVAYEQAREVFAPRAASRRILVRDLRTGRLLHSAPVAGSFVPPHGTFVSIVVRDDGAVAWIVETARVVNDFEVRSVDSSGNHVLSVGSDIAPGSLALAGNTLYWTQGGKPMSASLN